MNTSTRPNGIMTTKIDKRGLLIFTGVILIAYFILSYGGIGIKQIGLLVGGFIFYCYYKKTWHSPRAFVESFTGMVNDLISVSSEESAIMNDIHNKLPVTAKLEQLKIKYINVLTPFLENMETQEYAVGMLDKVNYYFQLMYSNIGLILTNEYYPQNNMVYLMDNQRKLMGQIDDFIFITNGSSRLPEPLAELKATATATFREVNQAIADFVNKKDENEMNNITGFIPAVDDPEPYNTYYQL
jgi:hypothetical protein